MPLEATWNLVPQNTQNKKTQNIDIGKLEKLSMLTIDKEIEKNINEAINIVERMCSVATDYAQPLVYYEYLE